VNVDDEDEMDKLGGIGGSEGNDEVLTSRRRESFIQARLDAEVAVQVAGQREPWDNDDSK
jgi:hypothetical protein